MSQDRALPATDTPPSTATGSRCARAGIYRAGCHPKELEAFLPGDRLPTCPRCDRATHWRLAEHPDEGGR